MSVRIPLHPSYVLSSGYIETTTLDGYPVSLLKDNGTKHTDTIKLDHLGLPPGGSVNLIEEPVLVAYYNKDKYNIATIQYYPGDFIYNGSVNMQGDIVLNGGDIASNPDVIFNPGGVTNIDCSSVVAESVLVGGNITYGSFIIQGGISANNIDVVGDVSATGATSSGINLTNSLHITNKLIISEEFYLKTNEYTNIKITYSGSPKPVSISSLSDDVYIDATGDLSITCKDSVVQFNTNTIINNTAYIPFDVVGYSDYLTNGIVDWASNIETTAGGITAIIPSSSPQYSINVFNYNIYGPRSENKVDNNIDYRSDRHITTEYSFNHSLTEKNINEDFILERTISSGGESNIPLFREHNGREVLEYRLLIPSCCASVITVGGVGSSSWAFFQGKYTIEIKEDSTPLSVPLRPHGFGFTSPGALSGDDGQYPLIMYISKTGDGFMVNFDRGYISRNRPFMYYMDLDTGPIPIPTGGDPYATTPALSYGLFPGNGDLTLTINPITTGTVYPLRLLYILGDPI